MPIRPDEIAVGTELLDKKTGIFHRWDGRNWVPTRRKDEDLRQYLTLSAGRGLLGALPFVPEDLLKSLDKRIESVAPLPNTRSYTAGEVARTAGRIIPEMVIGTGTANLLLRLPWLRGAATLPWLRGLPQRSIIGTASAAVPELMTGGYKKPPEELATNILTGTLVGAVVPAAGFRLAGPKKKIPRVVEETSPGAGAVARKVRRRKVRRREQRKTPQI
jgi:hypothetical protein